MSASKYSMSPLTDWKKYRLINKRKNNKPLRRKTSVEDLKEEGYTIGRILGEGSYCKVKAAVFEGHDIAVKVINRNHISLDFETKFLPRELNILARIRHPNIVHVHKIFRYPRHIYIFMEFIENGDLLHYIRKHGRLMEFEAHHYFRQMVNAIQYLHSLNIAHRDLKCENIMLNNSNQVKLVDFGFSRFTVDEDNHRVLSHTFCGSTAYAAPEVLEGIPYNPMMYDVWSLGCVLYIMLTGTMPFDDSNVRRMVKCQRKRQYAYPPTVTLSKPVKSLISSMLEPEVIKRANINHISQCLWLKKDIKEFRSRPQHKNGSSDSVPAHSVSTGTQTDILCSYGKHHSSGECNCRTRSDDSD